MKNFCDINCLESLIKEPACFKNPDKPTSIDLILTNRPNLLQHSSTFETGISDFLLLTVTEFKMGFQKLKPKIIAYRDYKNFDNAKFRYGIVTATPKVDKFGMHKSTIFNIFELKHADIVPIQKKKDKSDISIYRPVSILSNYSKVYEKPIYNQLYQCFENILFTSQCRFRKAYSTQHCLLVLIENFKEAIDTGNTFGALLTDLSKVFGCPDHSS